MLSSLSAHLPHCSSPTLPSKHLSTPVSAENASVSPPTPPPLLLMAPSSSSPPSPRHPRSHHHYPPKRKRSRLALALVYVFSLSLIGAFSFNNRYPEPSSTFVGSDDEPSSFPLPDTPVKTPLAPEAAVVGDRSLSPPSGLGIGSDTATREAKVGVLEKGSTLPSSVFGSSVKATANERKVGILENGSSSSSPSSGVRIGRAVFDSTNQPGFVEKKAGECDLYSGRWVKDQEGRYPLYSPGSCPYVEDSWSCQKNGRPDEEYLKWRWKPNGCDLPRFDAKDFLERLRGKTLTFVGDSMNRNQFESMLCLLSKALPNKSAMYGKRGYRITKHLGYFTVKFSDYNCTVAYCRSYFLVSRGARLDPHGKTRPTLFIDRVDNSSSLWKRADILIFNNGHWWTPQKIFAGKDYFQEGDSVYPSLNTEKAYRRAMRTWAAWMDRNMDTRKHTVFFRGYVNAYFRGGGWNSGGKCNKETKPAFRGSFLDNYPWQMKIAEDVIRKMKFPVILLNVTKLTNFRRDAHPSMYGVVRTKGIQDCSHWCLPGVPDAWNELIYANLVLRQFQAKEDG